MHCDTGITVVITTRQRPLLLPRAIDSALAQTHPPKEIIVVIDGIDVETENYLRSMDDPRLRVISFEHQMGGCIARNAGVAAATSEWIAFLDDDDEWLPNKLQTQIKLAVGTPAHYPIVSCRVAALTDQGKQFVWPVRPLTAGEHLSDYLLARETWTQGEGLITTSMILAPRALLLRIPFKPGLPRHQEWDWLLRAVASSEVEVMIAWDVLAIWHIEDARSSISRMNHWQTSFNWIRSMRRLVTPRAYASFLMVFVSAIAAREGNASALRIIFGEARRHGQPGAIDYLLMAAMWAVPQTTRRKLRNMFTPEAQTA